MRSHKEDNSGKKRGKVKCDKTHSHIVQDCVMFPTQRSPYSPIFVVEVVELNKSFPQSFAIPVLGPPPPPPQLTLWPCFVFSEVKSFGGSQPWPCQEKSWTSWSVTVSEGLRGREKQAGSDVTFGYRGWKGWVGTLGFHLLIFCKMSGWKIGL